MGYNNSNNNYNRINNNNNNNNNNKIILLIIITVLIKARTKDTKADTVVTEKTADSATRTETGLTTEQKS